MTELGNRLRWLEAIQLINDEAEKIRTDHVKSPTFGQFLLIGPTSERLPHMQKIQTLPLPQALFSSVFFVLSVWFISCFAEGANLKEAWIVFCLLPHFCTEVNSLIIAVSQ